MTGVDESDTATAKVDGPGLVDLLSAPASVAVVGASADLSRPAGRPLAYLLEHGYRGDIHVVNPQHHQIAGIDCVPAVGALPQSEVDAAIVSLSADRVPEVVAQLAERGVRAAVVIGSGFEADDSRPRHELLRTLRDGDLRLIGPNCVGVSAVRSGLHLSFSSVLRQERPALGRVALVTQSGALGNSLLMSLLRRGAGISHWFSTGNEFDVGALELVTGLLHRTDVDAVGLFLEGITDPAWLEPAAAAMRELGKPVYVLKAARTASGKLAASGHTGRVVGSADVSTAILAEAGFHELPSLEHLADALVCTDILGPIAGSRIGVVSVSGATAVLAADRIHGSSKLELAPPPAAAAMDHRISRSNPLDVPFLGETSVFTDAVSVLSADEDTDAVLTIESGLAHDPGELTAGLVARATRDTPVVVSYLCPDDPLRQEHIRRLAEHRVAVVSTVERAVDVLDVLTTAPKRAAVSDPSTPDVRTLGMEAIAGLTAADRLPWAPWRVVGELDEALEAAASFGFPVVVKAAGRTVGHRSELGAVRVGVHRDSLPDAFSSVAAVAHEYGDAVLVQKQVPAGFELLVSGVLDPEFGAVAIVRPGGVLAELLDGQVVVSASWAPDRRRQWLADSIIGGLLRGYRGGPRYDLAALADVVDGLLDLVARHRLTFLECNPVIVAEQGATLVDVLAAR